MTDASTSRDEETPLLEEGSEFHEPDTNSNQTKADVVNADTVNALYILPISFLAALGMAATAATSIFAYASLLCKDPTHCQDSEQNRYAGSVTLAVTIANICGIFVLGTLYRLSRNHWKAGLALWIICRSLSVVTLALGVYFNSIVIALSGRVFEGLASDNILHFSLNAIYVRTLNETHVSGLIGASLAFFMLGISISPALMCLFRNYVASFFVALGIFAFSFFYLLVLGGNKQLPTTIKTDQPIEVNPGERCQDIHSKTLTWKVCPSLTRTFLSPLQPFYEKPRSLASGLALLLYNTVQSYIFVLIMVHTSLLLGFSSRQNGKLLSIAHAASGGYLILVLFIIPAASTRYHRPGKNMETRQRDQATRKRDAWLGLFSLLMQIVALLGFANADKPWEIYVLTAFLALGLATPSFIKSHFLGFFPKDDATKAVGALAMMETAGALLSPLILGAWQTLSPGEGVFYGATGMMSFATVLFVAAVLAQDVMSPVESGS